MGHEAASSDAQPPQEGLQHGGTQPEREHRHQSSSGPGRVVYLCAIKNFHDKRIVGHAVSRFNNTPLVIRTVGMATQQTPPGQRKDLIMHSDQGSQFTSPVYVKLIKDNDVRHSVSHRGICVDDAPIESWLSALKTESIHL